MKKHAIYLLLYCLWVSVIIWLLGGCQSTKTPVDTAALAAIEQQLSSREFSVTAHWAMPLPDQALNQVANAGLLQPWNNANRINLDNNPNRFEVKGDSVIAVLPYYGERQVVSNYSGRQGIELRTVIQDWEVKQDRKQQYVILQFDARNRNENFQFHLRLYPGKKTLMTVSSNQRNMIRYEGELQEKG